MIFVTVGTQLPFDRLIRYIDEIAPDLDEPVFAQTGVSTYVPRNIEWSQMVNGARFNELMSEVRLIIGHAGIGTILAAQKRAKPLVLVPRLAAQREHRNDHQVATINSLRGRSGIYVAHTEAELRHLLSQSLAGPNAVQSDVARARLIAAVAQIIHT